MLLQISRAIFSIVYQAFVSVPDMMKECPGHKSNSLI